MNQKLFLILFILLELSQTHGILAVSTISLELSYSGDLQGNGDISYALSYTNTNKALKNKNILLNTSIVYKDASVNPQFKTSVTSTATKQDQVLANMANLLFFEQINIVLDQNKKNIALLKQKNELLRKRICEIKKQRHTLLTQSSSLIKNLEHTYGK
jgi:hypothetical protein